MRPSLGPSVALLALGALAVPARAQTNLRGWHADGQTWLVWEDDRSFASNESYSVFASPNPIASLAGTQLVGRLLPEDWRATRLKVADPTATFTIPDGLGGSTTLLPEEALMVLTPHQALTLWFAVVKTGETAVGPDNTVGPITQTTDPVRPHPQLSGTDAGHDYTAYALWVDGRADHASGRPGFPVMGNPSTNGVPHVFAVFQPSAPTPPGPLPAVLFLHGGEGSWWRFRPSMGPSAGMDLEVERGLYVTLDDYLPFWSGPGSDKILEKGTAWFGYRQEWDRFDDPDLVPPDGSLVVDYTQRRIDFVLDWLVATQGADEHRVGVIGQSAGGVGTNGYARARATRVAAATTFVMAPEPGDGLPAIWGLPAQNLPTTLPGSPGIRDYFVPTNAILPGDVPFMRWAHGTEDEGVGWLGVPPMYAAVDALRWGTHVFWDERTHTGWNGAWEHAHWFESPLFAARALTEHRNDRSFPAITDVDHSALPGRQPDPGDDVYPADGDAWGTWGGWIGWDADTLVDEPERWGVTLHAVQPAALPMPVPRCASFTITPRRVQQFLPAPHQNLHWTLVDVATGVLLDEGWVNADADGRVSVEGLLTRGPAARFEVEVPGP